MIQRPNGQIQTTILVSKEFHDLAKENRIKLTEAFRVGMSILLADKGLREYDNRLTLHRKMTAMRTQLEETSAKLAELETKQDKIIE